MNEMTSYLGWTIDYAHPKGEPALMHPLSMHWRVFKNPIALGTGGVAAVLMEFADPGIRSGVWDHSTYKADPIARSKRTGVAALAGVYGPQSAARRIIQGVTNMHAKVNGVTPGGKAYRALDPDLLNWVAATAQYGMLMGYDRFVAPVSDADKDRYFAESANDEGFYGVTYAPGSVADFMAMAKAREAVFEPHPIVIEFLDIIQSGRAAPGTPRFLHQALGRAAVSLLPPAIRDKLELGRKYDLTFSDRLALKAAGRLADRVKPGSAPWDAALRLGLPGDFLNRSVRDQQRLVEAAGLAEATLAA